MPVVQPLSDITKDQPRAAGKPPAFLFYALLAIVLIAPLPFASISVWAWAPLAALTAALLAVWAVLLATGRMGLSVAPRKIAFPAILFAATIAWILVQMVTITPSSWHHPIWSEAATVLRSGLSGRITVDPFETSGALTRLLWYASIFWLALQVCREEKMAQRALNALAIAGFGYAAYGLVIEFGGFERVLWLKKFAYQDSLTSTFINKNSYAAYAGFGLVCLTALISRRMAALGTAGTALGERLARALNIYFAQSWYLLLAWIVVLTALILANSRAGLVSSLLGIFALLGALTLSRSASRRVLLWSTAIVTVAVMAFILFSGDLVGRRFSDSIEQSRGRIAIYELTLEAIGDSPILGMGFGTYRQVFQLYRKPIAEFRAPAAQAHNTYLENALELGVPTASALVLSVGSLVLLCLLGVRRRRRGAIYPATAVGAGVLLAFHSTIDFSLQMPAIAASFAFILGLGCAQSWSSRE